MQCEACTRKDQDQKQQQKNKHSSPLQGLPDVDNICLPGIPKWETLCNPNGDFLTNAAEWTPDATAFRRQDAWHNAPESRASRTRNLAFRLQESGS